MIFHLHLNGPKFTPEINIGATSSSASESNEIYYDNHRGKEYMKFSKCKVCSERTQGAKILWYKENPQSKK